MSALGCVYIIENKVNGLLYVGRTQHTYARRWRGHLCDTRRGSLHPLHCAIRQYGPAAFEIREISPNPATERLWIIALNTIDPAIGYNVTTTGLGGIQSPEVIARRTAHGCRYLNTPAVWAKRAITLMGHVVSEETRRKIADTRRARGIKPIVRQHTPETKRLLSEKRIGKKNPGRAAAWQQWREQRAKEALCQR